VSYFDPPMPDFDIRMGQSQTTMIRLLSPWKEFCIFVPIIIAQLCCLPTLRPPESSTSTYNVSVFIGTYTRTNIPDLVSNLDQEKSKDEWS